MKIKVIITIISIFFIQGCSTKYQEMGVFGGVSAEQISSDTFRIKARGNEFTTSSKVEDFVMMKAAEVTINAGKTHFLLSKTRDTSTNYQIQNPSYVDTYRTRYGSHSVVRGGGNFTTFEPGQDTFIKLLTFSEGQEIPPGIFSAKEVLHFTGKRLKEKNSLEL